MFKHIVGGDEENSFGNQTAAIDAAERRAAGLCMRSGAPETVTVIDGDGNVVGSARASVKSQWSWAKRT